MNPFASVISASSLGRGNGWETRIDGDGDRGNNATPIPLWGPGCDLMGYVDSTYPCYIFKSFQNASEFGITLSKVDLHLFFQFHGKKLVSLLCYSSFGFLVNYLCKRSPATRARAVSSCMTELRPSTKKHDKS